MMDQDRKRTAKRRKTTQESRLEPVSPIELWLVAGGGGGGLRDAGLASASRIPEARMPVQKPRDCAPTLAGDVAVLDGEGEGPQLFPERELALRASRTSAERIDASVGAQAAAAVGRSRLSCEPCSREKSGQRDRSDDASELPNAGSFSQLWRMNSRRPRSM